MWKDTIKKQDKEVMRIINLLEQVEKGIINIMEGMRTVCACDIDANLCMSKSPRPELSHAQGFISKSLTVASEYSTENPSFSEIRIFFHQTLLHFPA